MKADKLHRNRIADCRWTQHLESRWPQHTVSRACRHATKTQERVCDHIRICHPKTPANVNQMAETDAWAAPVYLLVKVISKCFDICGCLHPESYFTLPLGDLSIIWVLGIGVPLLHIQHTCSPAKSRLPRVTPSPYKSILHKQVTKLRPRCITLQHTET